MEKRNILILVLVFIVGFAIGLNQGAKSIAGRTIGNVDGSGAGSVCNKVHTDLIFNCLGRELVYQNDENSVKEFIIRIYSPYFVKNDFMEGKCSETPGCSEILPLEKFEKGKLNIDKSVIDWLFFTAEVYRIDFTPIIEVDGQDITCETKSISFT